MKKLLFLLLILFSCQKEDNCYSCRLNTTVYTDGKITKQESKEVPICDMTGEQIFDYERKNTITTEVVIPDSYYGNRIIKTVKSCKCEK
jgi:hypothetical protein